MQYYLHDGQDQYGPFTLDELRSQSLLKPDTLVWCEGMTEWLKASHIEELKAVLKSVPPPLVKPPAITIPGAKASPAPLMLQPASSGFAAWKAIAIIVVVLVLAYAGYAVYDKQQQENQEQERIVREESLKKQVRDNIRAYVQAGNSEYRISVLGGVYGLSITVSNQTEYLLDNVRVLIRYIKANGETWKEETLDFALVPPNNKMTLRAPDSDRGTSVDYKIVSIKSEALGL